MKEFSFREKIRDYCVPIRKSIRSEVNMLAAKSIDAVLDAIVNKVVTVIQVLVMA